MKKTERNLTGTLTLWSLILFLLSGIVYYLYEEYLDTKIHVRYYCIYFTAKMPDEVTDDDFSNFIQYNVRYQRCGSGNTNDSLDMKNMREQKISNKNSDMVWLKSHISKLEKKVRNSKDIVAPIELKAYKKLLDSVRTTRIYVLRLSFVRKFNVKSFEGTLDASESSIYDYFKQVDELYKDDKNASYAYHRIL